MRPGGGISPHPEYASKTKPKPMRAQPATEQKPLIKLVVLLPPKPDNAPNITRATHCPVIGNQTRLPR